MSNEQLRDEIARIICDSRCDYFTHEICTWNKDGKPCPANLTFADSILTLISQHKEELAKECEYISTEQSKLYCEAVQSLITKEVTEQTLAVAMAMPEESFKKLIKLLGYVKLDEDQKLPELYPETFAEGMRLPDVNELQRYRNAMNWLIHEANFRKVKEQTDDK